MAIDFFLCFVEYGIVYVVSQQKDFGRVVHATVFFLSDVDDIAHVREPFTLHVPAFESLQLGKHPVSHIYKTAVLFPIDDT